jgi:hypothetical protein
MHFSFGLYGCEIWFLILREEQNECMKMKCRARSLHGKRVNNLKYLKTRNFMIYMGHFVTVYESDICRQHF